MANLVRSKLALSLISVAIIILIPLLRSKFNTSVTIKRWGNLSWNDFQGYYRPLTRYGAGISSKVYLEKDSITKQFHAYAGQNNIQSWTNFNDDYGLNHEQYHFNITEIFARKLNEYIKDFPDLGEIAYTSKLGQQEFYLNKMQDDYDWESDHSTIVSQQYRWEFKVDSLLRLDSGWVIDNYSGAKAYFPSMPEFKHGIDNNFVYRNYASKKYQVALSISSFQFENAIDTKSARNTFDPYEPEDYWQIMSQSIDTINYPLKAYLIVADTIHHLISHQLTIVTDDYSYKCYASYENKTGEISGLELIAKSFINSFSIVNTNKFWMNKLDMESSDVGITKMFPVVKNQKVTFGNCLKFGNSKMRGFSKGPFIRDDGSLIIAQDVIEHKDSLVSKSILKLGNMVLDMKPDKDGQIYFLPNNLVPKKETKLAFGYVLKSDKNKDCSIFYYQSFSFKPENRIQLETH